MSVSSGGQGQGGRSLSLNQTRKQNRERVKALQREQMEQRKEFQKLKAAGGVNPNVVLQFPSRNSLTNLNTAATNTDNLTAQIQQHQQIRQQLKATTQPTFIN